MLRQLLLLVVVVATFCLFIDGKPERQDKRAGKQQQQQPQPLIAPRENNADSTDEDHEWKSFREKHKRNYPNKEEEKHRRGLWKTNLKQIAEHNREYEAGLQTYRQAVNNFADWTAGEYEQLLGARKVNKHSKPESQSESQSDEEVQALGDDCKDFIPDDSWFSDLPPDFDWRDIGGVSEVKNQGEVATCYAFSAVAAVESHLLIFENVDLKLSEQQIVDCSYTDGNAGVYSGMPYRALVNMMDQGCVGEDSYQYTQTNGRCEYNDTDIVATVGGCYRLPMFNETALKAAVAVKGPISVVIDSRPSLKFYSYGVYKDENCTLDYNHAVLVVGYGTGKIDGDGDYWIIKNSWGEKWGEEGYFKLRRNSNNNCSVATECVFPFNVKLSQAITPVLDILVVDTK